MFHMQVVKIKDAMTVSLRIERSLSVIPGILVPLK
jgi:hypothetical protein